jgi:hypothetical protein
MEAPAVIADAGWLALNVKCAGAVMGLTGHHRRRVRRIVVLITTVAG